MKPNASATATSQEGKSLLHPSYLDQCRSQTACVQEEKCAQLELISNRKTKQPS